MNGSESPMKTGSESACCAADARARPFPQAVAFTSAPAAESFLETVDEMRLRSTVAEALHGSVVAACVGPVTAGPLGQAGIPCVVPSRGRLGALIREIVQQVPARRGVPLRAAGRALDVRGQAVVVDGVLVPLPAASMTLLRALAAKAGRVVSRVDLLGLTGTTDEHALEVAVGRLRTSLGDPRIIRTVVKRGYRIDCEPVPAFPVRAVEVSGRHDLGA